MEKNPFLKTPRRPTRASVMPLSVFREANQYKTIRNRDKHMGIHINQTQFFNKELVRTLASKDSGTHKKTVANRTSAFLLATAMMDDNMAKLQKSTLANPNDPSYLPLEAFKLIDTLGFRVRAKLRGGNRRDQAEAVQTMLFDYVTEKMDGSDLQKDLVSRYGALSNFRVATVAQIVGVDSDNLDASSGGIVLSGDQSAKKLDFSSNSPQTSINSKAATAGASMGGDNPPSPESSPDMAGEMAHTPLSSMSSLQSMKSLGSMGDGSVSRGSMSGNDGSACDPDDTDSDDSDDSDIPQQQTNYPNSDTLGPKRDGTTNGGADVKGQFGHNEFRKPRPVGVSEDQAVPTFEGDKSFSTGPGHDEKGDFFNDVQTTDTSKGTLRPRFGMEKASNVIPSAEDQILSDLRFDMFDTVNAGFGEGDDNKLFLMQTNRDAKIVNLDPMFTPGEYIGPEAGVGVTSWKLQRTIPTEKMAEYEMQVRNQISDIRGLISVGRDETTNVLGDDIGFDRPYSSKGLKRTRGSIFAPIVSNEMEFSRVKMPTGAELNGYDFRRMTDAMRYPRHLASNTNGMGGPTLNKRRSLAIINQ